MVKTVGSPHPKGKKAENTKTFLPTGMKSMSKKEIDDMSRLIGAYVNLKDQKQTGNPSNAVVRKP